MLKGEAAYILSLLLEMSTVSSLQCLPSSKDFHMKFGASRNNNSNQPGSNPHNSPHTARSRLTRLRFPVRIRAVVRDLKQLSLPKYTELDGTLILSQLKIQCVTARLISYGSLVAGLNFFVVSKVSLVGGVYNSSMQMVSDGALSGLLSVALIFGGVFMRTHTSSLQDQIRAAKQRATQI